MKNNKENEEKLNELFQEGSSDKKMEDLVKKAKRNSILRNIGISLFVGIGLFIVLGVLWLSVIRWSQGNAQRNIELFSTITNPNVEQQGVQQMSNGLFEGVLIYDRYKVINGVPVDWSDQVMTYSLWGGVSSLTGDHSPIALRDEDDGHINYYNRETKQRVMQFYHPEIKYDYIKNDLENLDNFHNETSLEVALSFDKRLSPEKVRKFVPDNVNLKWYWVDTYTEKDRELLRGKVESLETGNKVTIPASPELATYIYGFDHIEENPSGSEKRFINKIEEGLRFENGKYYNEYKEIHNYLAEDSKSIQEEDVKVLGVVVTGTVEELTTLKDLKMIRSSVFGVSTRGLGR